MVSAAVLVYDFDCIFHNKMLIWTYYNDYDYNLNKPHFHKVTNEDLIANEWILKDF